MKKIILYLLYMAAAQTAAAQPALQADKAVYDFGAITQETPVTAVFEITNVTENPQILLHAATSCGCTTIDFPKAPIKAGEKAEIKVTYDPQGRPGAFERQVTLFTIDRKIATRLKITGYVQDY